MRPSSPASQQSHAVQVGSCRGSSSASENRSLERPPNANGTTARWLIVWACLHHDCTSNQPRIAGLESKGI
jgi:hypothetical protein